MMSRFTWLVPLAVLAGCGERPYNATAAPGYEKRPDAPAWIFQDPGSHLSSSDYAQLLGSKVPIPAHATVALLADATSADGLPGEDGTVPEGIAAALRVNPRVASVGRIPQLILPRTQRDLGAVRDACARMQCDLVMIYAIDPRIEVHSRTFGADSFTVRACAEAMLVDVRTGLVPWCDVVDAPRLNLSGKDVGDDPWAQVEERILPQLATALASDIDGFFKRAPPASG